LSWAEGVVTGGGTTGTETPETVGSGRTRVGNTNSSERPRRGRRVGGPCGPILHLFQKLASFREARREAATWRIRSELPGLGSGLLEIHKSGSIIPLPPMLALAVFVFLASSRRWWGTLAVVGTLSSGGALYLRSVRGGVHAALAIYSSHCTHRDRRGI